MTYRYGSHQKEVAVWFQASQRSAGMPYCPTSSPIHMELTHTFNYMEL